MARSGEVRIVCTDRNTHASREVALVIRAAPGDSAMRAGGPLTLVSERSPGRGRSVVTRRAEIRRSDGRPALWCLPCPTCGRDVQLREPRVLAIVDALLADTPTTNVTFDLSALPANLG